MSNFGKDVQWIQICDAARDGNFNIAGLIAADNYYFAEDLINFYQDEAVHILEKATDIALIAELAQSFRDIRREREK